MERSNVALGLSGKSRQNRVFTWLAAALLLALTPRCQILKEPGIPAPHSARGHPAIADSLLPSSLESAVDIPSSPLDRDTNLASSTDTDHGPMLAASPLPRTEPASPAADKPRIDNITIIPSEPVDGQPMRVVATTRSLHRKLKLTVRGPKGKPVTANRIESWGYIPRAESLYLDKASAGAYQAVLIDEESSEIAALVEFDVARMERAPEDTPLPSGAWPVTRSWSPAMEDLYSVFIAKLFYVRPGSRKGWHPLDQATRDPFRNILYGVMGYNEDHQESKTRVKLEPDCGDAPYQIRAYFSWKMGLPFMFNRCLRGSSVSGPSCRSTHSNLTRRYDNIDNPVDRFNAFASSYIGWKVHSGNGRTLPGSDTSDFYPLPLDTESIRPGAVFVDAGGHVILVSQVEPQTKSNIGALYGIDSHPDRTVTHKRFGIGTFVFNHRVPTDGFKGFRPVVQDAGGLRYLSNQEINRSGGFARQSLTQARMESTKDFYNTMMKVLNPVPLDPRKVMAIKLDILHKAMLERVEAVDLGVAYMKRVGWKKMAMPKGPAIFQTTGPWEIYSTPARDMRCFLAMDDVMQFPEEVRNNESIYLTAPGESTDDLIEDLVAIRDEGLKERTIEYTRSDGSAWSLTLQDIIDRQTQLEVAYNPNDCPETRWAASKGSDEGSTCVRKAPPDQRFYMKLCRHWFTARRRPDQR